MEQPSEARRFIDLVCRREAEALRSYLNTTPAALGLVDQPLFSFGKTALIEARESRDTVEVLLEAAADPHLKSDWECGPYGVLHENSEEMVRFFLEKGVALDAHVASEHGWVSELESLHSEDAECVMRRGPDGQYPLHYAHSVEVAAFLLSCGAELNARCLDHDSTAVQYLVSRRPEVAEFLISKGASCDLPAAVVLGDLELVERALAEDPLCLGRAAGEGRGDINRWRLHNLTPASLAADHEHWGLFDWLCEKLPSEEEFLERARAGQLEPCQKMLGKEPALKRVLRERAKLLPDAAWHGRTASVRVLLELGFFVDAPGDHCSTALDRAAIRGFRPIVELCLEYGADLECVNEFGGRALSSACWGSVNWREPEGDYAGVVEALLRAGCRGDQEPSEEDPRGLRGLVPWMLENEVSPEILKLFADSGVLPKSVQHMLPPPL